MRNKITSKNWMVALVAVLITTLACSISTPDPTPEPIATEAAIAPTEEAAPEIEFLLTASRLPVTIGKADGSQVELTENEIISIETGDTISIGKGGQGHMQAGKKLKVQLFQNATLQLTDVNTAANGNATISFDQASGQTVFTVPEGAQTTVILTTIYVKITTVTDDTEFIVCHDPKNAKLTCNDVRRGEIELEAEGKVISLKANEASYTLEGQSTVWPPICEHTEEVEAWLEQLRNVEDVPPLGALVARWFTEPCPGEEPLPTEEGPFAPPVTPYVHILNITLDDQQRYVVEYETFDYTEALPGMHVHFFFNTVYPENAGSPGKGPWKVYGGPRPFTGYGVGNRPTGATQMCALVANPNHSIQYDSGNCVDLPE